MPQRKRRSSRKHSDDDEELTLVHFTDRPPSGRPRKMDILARTEAVSGDVIEVSAVERKSGRPVPDVELTLAEFGGDVVATVQAGADGRAAFVAPVVELPTAFEVRARRDGHTTYIYQNELVARLNAFANGFLPVTGITVVPRLFYSFRPSPVFKDFEIDRGLGWTGIYPVFNTLIEKMRKLKGWRGNNEGWVGKSGILEHLEHKGPEDCWTFFGHTGKASDGMTKAIMAWRPFAVVRNGEPILAKEICDAMKKAKGAPSIIVLGGCKSADMADDLVKCCAKIVVGFTEPNDVGNIARALVRFWEALLDGKTLDYAINEGNRVTNSGKFIYRTKPEIANPGGLTLDEILALVLPSPHPDNH